MKFSPPPLIEMKGSGSKFNTVRKQNGPLTQNPKHRGEGPSAPVEARPIIVN